MPPVVFRTLVVVMGFMGALAIGIVLFDVVRIIRRGLALLRVEIIVSRNDRPHPDSWLRAIGRDGLAMLGHGLRVTDYQVDLTGLGETPAWVEFQVQVFNGGVYRIAITEVSGAIIYTDEQGRFEPITPAPTLAWLPSAASRWGEFTLALRQELNQAMQDAVLLHDPRGGKNVIEGFSMSGIRLGLKPEVEGNVTTRSEWVTPFRNTVPRGQPFRVIGR